MSDDQARDAQLAAEVRARIGIGTAEGFAKWHRAACAIVADMIAMIRETRSKMPSKPWDCAQAGHHYHEGNGNVFVRHKNRPDEPVDIHCCHCLVTAQQSGYGQLTQPPSMFEVAKASAGCGPHAIPPWAVTRHD